MNTYYINSATGNNANDGSPGAPWLTIEYAFATADWTADILFDLTGTFDLAAPLDATNPNANIDVVFVFCSTTDAVVNLNHANGWINHWAYRRMSLRGLVCNCTRSLALQGLEVINCTINFNFAGAYTQVSYGWQFHNCTISGTGAGALMQFSHDVQFVDCTLMNIRYIYMPSGGETVAFIRCLFVDCSSTHTTWFSVTTPTVKRQTCIHCTFVNVSVPTGTIINPGERDTAFMFCVFQNCTDIGGSVRHFEWWRFNTPRGIANGMFEADHTLTTAPFESPDYNTPSSELAAITGSDGLTPGHIQAGGSSKKSSPFHSVALRA